MLDYCNPKLVAFSENTAAPDYNDTVLYNTSPIASDILWYQVIPHRLP
jgi:hypothetical protein